MWADDIGCSMMGKKDYYSILGVDKHASQEDIQKAFRVLAHKYHPDKQGGDVEKFKEVNEAYQVLGDQQKRAQYDATSDPLRGSGFEGFDFKDFDFNFSSGGGFADVINSVFRGAMGRGEDILIDLTITFEESIFGVTKKIVVPYRRKSSESIEVPVPAGIESGSRLQFQGRGEPPKDGRSSPGNLFIRVRVQEHNHFERNGGDVQCFLSLTPTEAILGTKKEMRDLRGDMFEIVVPEMSGEGTSVAIHGKGIPQPVGTGRLVVIFRIMYPNKITRKVRTLLQSLREEGW